MYSGNKKKSVLYFFLKLIFTAAAIWIIFTFVFGLMTVKGETMYPRLRDGDRIMYYRIDRNYHIGEVVVFKNGENTRTARIVAQAGDLVEINEDGQLLINGNIQSEEIFYPTYTIPGDISYPYRVGEGEYFLLCDFRTQSSDSREFGAISENAIKGKVISVFRSRGI